MSAVTLNVIVFGPGDKDTRPSGCLRRRLLDHCRKYGCTPRTEHSDMARLDASMKHNLTNLCTMEKDHVLNADAIVIIPDSPGSFVELGMFALHKDIPSKCLLLLDREYFPTSPESFVALGPVKAYAQKHARIEYVQYQEADEVTSLVDGFLGDRQVVKYDQQY